MWDFYGVHGRLSTGNHHLIDGFFQLEVSSLIDFNWGMGGRDLLVKRLTFSHFISSLLQEDCATIASPAFTKMKSSLLCLILALDLEEHNWMELVRAYQQFGKDITKEHINLLVRRGISMAVHRGGLSAAKEFWDSLQRNSIISDPGFLAITNQAIERGDLDEVLITNEEFVTRFLSHIRDRFGPSILLPSFDVEGKNGL